MRYLAIMMVMTMTIPAVGRATDLKQDSAMHANPPTTGSVTSLDGTQIGYRQYGHGPGLIIVQGAMGTAYNYDELARALADEFTVYVPDRRGRGLTPKDFTADYSIQNEIQDVDSLIRKTDAHFLFGLSSGAIIAMEATRTLSSVHKAVIYEPPYQKGYSVELRERLNSEVSRGDLAAALVTLSKIVRLGPAIMNFIPRPILEIMTGRAIRAEDEKGTGNYASLRDLIPSTRFDVRIVAEMADKAELYKDVRPEVLLLGGSNSPTYLKDALSSLQNILPHARRIELEGLDHSGPWNSDRQGQPRKVAEAMREFLKK